MMRAMDASRLAAVLTTLVIGAAGAWPPFARADIDEPLDARVELDGITARWLGENPSVRLLPATLYEIHQLPMPPLPLRTMDVSLTHSEDDRHWVVVESNLPAPAEPMTLLVAIQGASDSLIRRLEVVPVAPALAADSGAESPPQTARATPEPQISGAQDTQLWGWIATAGLLFTLLWSHRSARTRTTGSTRVTSLTRRVAATPRPASGAAAPSSTTGASGGAAEAMLAKLAQIRAEREAENSAAATDGMEISFGDEPPLGAPALDSADLAEPDDASDTAHSPEISELGLVYEQAQQYLQSLDMINGSTPSIPKDTPKSNPLFVTDAHDAHERELSRLFASIAAYQDKLERLSLAGPSADESADGAPRGDTGPMIRLTDTIREKLAEISLIVSQSGNAEHGHWLLNHLLKSAPHAETASQPPASGAPHREEAQ